MTVVDAYALISALTEEPDDEIRSLFADPASPARISTVNLAEVFDVTVRVMRLASDEISGGIGELARIDRLQIVPCDGTIGRRAGFLRALHYDKARRNVSLADCIAAATAEALSELLATPDPDLAVLARDIGLGVIALRDSSGKRP